MLDRTEECIHNSETDINDLQAQSVVLDRTISLLSSVALTDIEQDRIEWESLVVAFAEVLRAIQILLVIHNWTQGNLEGESGNLSEVT